MNQDWFEEITTNDHQGPIFNLSYQTLAILRSVQVARFGGISPQTSVFCPCVKLESGHDTLFPRSVLLPVPPPVLPLRLLLRFADGNQMVWNSHADSLGTNHMGNRNSIVLKVPSTGALLIVFPTHNGLLIAAKPATPPTLKRGLIDGPN
ncbi:hypothetical protein DPEC_G00083600 [Dallia pectoralis]|uniref:Uncharacterized protein n=1 Tax=Dallia pectoralis TaxID=75939 RepID=A0ACC2GZL6_DALPE|nr:hypothetical protein DPEC_G00083600 [Dallia pectoralis]